MSDEVRCALLILDYQVGAGDRPYAAQTAKQAEAALKSARKANLPVFFSVIGFMPDYADVANSNKVFEQIKQKHLLPPGGSTVISLLQPAPGEVVVSKNRFSAFSGNALQHALRARQINHLVMAGVTTSGVILATYVDAADMDYSMTILSDACADPDTGLENELMRSLFPRSASVATVDDWITALKKQGSQA